MHPRSRNFIVYTALEGFLVLLLLGFFVENKPLRIIIGAIVMVVTFVIIPAWVIYQEIKDGW